MISRIYFPDRHSLNPIAHRKATITYNFGLAECNRVNEIKFTIRVDP